PMPERDSVFRIDPVAVGVGPAMSERPRHAHERRQRPRRGVALRTQEPRMAHIDGREPGPPFRASAGRQGRAMGKYPKWASATPLRDRAVQKRNETPTST